MEFYTGFEMKIQMKGEGMKRFSGFWKMMWSAVFVAFVSAVYAPASMAALVELDPTKTGIEAVTFNPGEFVTPVIMAIVGIFTALGALWLVTIGMGYLKRLVHKG